MNLRGRQTDLTRTAILDAADEVFLNGNPGEFTMQAIADKAGVSHRTLYRHFESRRDLTNEMGKRMDERLVGDIGAASDLPDSFETYVGRVGDHVAHGRAYRAVLRRALITSISGAEWRSDRDDHYWRLFRDEFPHLEEAAARADFAVLRHVLGSMSVVLIGERFGVDDELPAALERAGRALVDAIAARDREAAEPEGKTA